MTFAEYHQLILLTAKAEYHDLDPISPHIPLYSLLEMVDEVGEVVKLAKKAARSGSEMDKAKLALEIGDALWALADLANTMGFTIEDVAALNNTKLRRRLQAGKQEEAELEIARIFFRAKEETEK